MQILVTAMTAISIALTAVPAISAPGEGEGQDAPNSLACDWDSFLDRIFPDNEQDQKHRLDGYDSDSMLGWMSDADALGAIEQVMLSDDTNYLTVWTIIRAVWNQGMEPHSDVNWHAGQLSVGVLEANQVAFVIEDSLFTGANTWNRPLFFGRFNKRIDTEAYYGYHPRINPEYLEKDKIQRVSCLGIESIENGSGNERLYVRVRIIETLEIDDQHRYTVRLSFHNEGTTGVGIRFLPAGPLSSKNFAGQQECFLRVLETDSPWEIEYATPKAPQPALYGIIVSNVGDDDPLVTAYLRTLD